MLRLSVSSIHSGSHKWVQAVADEAPFPDASTMNRIMDEVRIRSLYVDYCNGIPKVFQGKCGI